MNGTKQQNWNNHFKWPMYVFLAIGTYFVWTEHQAYVIEYLPLTLILACVGMHFFMHGSHGGHNGPKDHGAGSHTKTNHSAANAESDSDDSGANS